MAEMKQDRDKAAGVTYDLQMLLRGGQHDRQDQNEWDDHSSPSQERSASVEEYTMNRNSNRAFLSLRGIVGEQPGR